MQYVKKHYGNALVIFDGYPDDLTNSLKTVERLRRQKKSVGREINFDLNTRLTVPQEKFLSNSKNKQRLINLLSRALVESDCSTALADEDADVLLVDSSIDLAKTGKDVVLVGQDIDLLVLLTQKTPAELTVYFLKKGKTYQSDCWYSNKSLRYNLLQKYIAFLHVVTGCDTVSCMHKQGKNKLLKAFFCSY